MGEETGIKFHVMQCMRTCACVCVCEKREPLTSEVSQTKLLLFITVLILMWKEPCLWWKSAMRLNGCVTITSWNVKKCYEPF